MTDTMTRESLFSFVLGATVAIVAFASLMPAPATSAPATSAPAAECEPIGNSICRTDDRERGVSCYTTRQNRIEKLDCVYVPGLREQHETR
ncbi:hypothetical protein AchV4_0055 [Achromobacter phage vB_AchrS_AchV4]|uniref:Uncharacterized protein n=1 Tax=Achromobacter phage vB_AchrS_AchV4 TaxID=2796514 RepID=A0A7T3PGX1_9CAUD|nr:hypothetical protein JT316_gp55 [Achromobacter phage vB_AchrS_AchV4]QPZ53294.1 hypothetical protein AchV4_0055 [Achromobacter phage vB_AchrS_AchV4]